MSGLGFAIGMTAAIPAIQASMQTAYSPPMPPQQGPVMIPAAPAPTFSPVVNVQGASGGRGGGFNVEINVNVGGGGNVSEIATSAADAVRLAMQSVLEQYGAEVGA
jgi:hypothetical protein